MIYKQHYRCKIGLSATTVESRTVDSELAASPHVEAKHLGPSARPSEQSLWLQRLQQVSAPASGLRPAAPEFRKAGPSQRPNRTRLVKFLRCSTFPLLHDAVTSHTTKKHATRIRTSRSHSGMQAFTHMTYRRTGTQAACRCEMQDTLAHRQQVPSLGATSRRGAGPCGAGRAQGRADLQRGAGILEISNKMLLHGSIRSLLYFCQVVKKSQKKCSCRLEPFKEPKKSETQTRARDSESSATETRGVTNIEPIDFQLCSF